MDGASAIDWTPVAKTVPAARAAGLLARPALAARISEVLERRLTLVVADAGFGKSTLLSTWWETAPCAFYTLDASDRDLRTLVRGLLAALRLHVPDLPADQLAPAPGALGAELEQLTQADAIGAQLAEALRAARAEPLVIMVDDLHEIDGASVCMRLIEALCRHAPGTLHLVLAGRRWPSFPVARLRGQGQVLVLDADRLAFTPEEVGELLSARLGEAARESSARLHALTAGWPAAVALAMEALRETEPAGWPRVIDRLAERGTPLYEYLAEEVFAVHRGPVRELIRATARLEWFTPELCTHLGLADAPDTLAALSREALFVEARQDGTMALRPLVRDFALHALALPGDARRALRISAAGWYVEAGSPGAGLALLLGAGAPDELAQILAAHGPDILAAGRVNAVLDGCRELSGGDRTAAIDQLEGDALQALGEWAQALACFERAAQRSEHLTATLAWRIGFLRDQRGDFDGALDAYRQGREDPDASPSERALLLAWSATVHWIRGEVAECRRLSTDAHAAAMASGDPRPLAAAHTALAMLAAVDGDRRANDAHYLWALRAAEQASDVMQIVRIHTNRASHFTEEGACAQALAELDVAIPLAEVNSLTSFLGLALCNRGQARQRLGQLDEALADFEASRATCERIESDMVSYALAGIGDVQRERGNLAQARAAYQEAVAVAQRWGDVQGLVPARAGLALVTAAYDTAEATRLAAQALEGETGLGQVQALLSAGWVAARAGDQDRAAGCAEQAVEVARPRRDRAGVAEALTLAALTTADRGAGARRLRDALALHREIGDQVGEGKALLALAVLGPGGQRASAQRRQAQRRLEALGIRVAPGGNVAAGVIAQLAPDTAVEVSIQTLGGFAVLRDGHQVQRSQWQSRRARELLKLLVARRGRPATRSMLMEALWPDEDPQRVANRLSVALSTIRAILSPARDADYVIADQDTVALDIDRLDVDLERFLSGAEDGLARLRAGETELGLSLLQGAEVVYAGDFLEDNPYDDWAVPAREEARAAYVASARALARHAADPDAGVRYLLRILEVDRFDEDANLELVAALAAARRHGEAQRAYRAYRRAMDDLGVEPMAFPEQPRRPPH